MMQGPALPFRLIFAAALVSLGGCGVQHELKPRSGTQAVPVATGATKPATSDELMTQSPQARPDHSAEPLKRSQERQDDPFDLPPGK